MAAVALDAEPCQWRPACFDKSSGVQLGLAVANHSVATAPACSNKPGGGGDM